MKKNLFKLIAILLFAVLLVISAASCDIMNRNGEGINESDLWENATYLSDTSLGSGKNTVTLEVIAGERSITFTIKTDKPTLGDALLELGLINDISGLFTVCNGMTADWNKNQAYWSFYVNGDIAMFGVYDEQASTSSDNVYKIVYTK